MGQLSVGSGSKIINYLMKYSDRVVATRIIYEPHASCREHVPFLIYVIESLLLVGLCRLYFVLITFLYIVRVDFSIYLENFLRVYIDIC